MAVQNTSFLFLPEPSGTHRHQHPPWTTLIVGNIALITTTHTHIYSYTHAHIYIYIYIYNIFNFHFSPSHNQQTIMLSTIVFFSIKDTLTTPLKPDALLTYQHHKGNPSSTQYTCGCHWVQLRMTTQPQQQTGVTPSHPDHYRQTIQEPWAPSGAYQ